MDSMHPLYEDSAVICDETGVTIKRYYFPWGAKYVPYNKIDAVSELPFSGINRLRRWRIWGSGDLLHWWSLDVNRSKKQSAIVLKLRGHWRPSFTPDTTHAVLEIISARISA